MVIQGKGSRGDGMFQTDRSRATVGMGTPNPDSPVPTGVQSLSGRTEKHQR